MSVPSVILVGSPLRAHDPTDGISSMTDCPRLMPAQTLAALIFAGTEHSKLACAKIFTGGHGGMSGIVARGPRRPSGQTPPVQNPQAAPNAEV